MFKTDSFLDNKKLSFNQNVWRDHATMQQDVLLHFWQLIFGQYFFIEIRLKYEKIILLSSSRAFLLSTPTFLLFAPMDNSEATYPEKTTKCNNLICYAMIYKNSWYVLLSCCPLMSYISSKVECQLSWARMYTIKGILKSQHQK